MGRMNQYHDQQDGGDKGKAERFELREEVSINARGPIELMKRMAEQMVEGIAKLHQTFEDAAGTADESEGTTTMRIPDDMRDAMIADGVPAAGIPKSVKIHLKLNVRLTPQF